MRSLRSHEKAPRADGESWLASIQLIIERNTAKFRAVRGLDAVAVDQLDAASRDAATTLQPLLKQRAEQGFVRRCHGDLHLANIALVDGRPLLVRCHRIRSRYRDDGCALRSRLYADGSGPLRSVLRRQTRCSIATLRGQGMKVSMASASCHCFCRCGRQSGRMCCS